MQLSAIGLILLGLIISYCAGRLHQWVLEIEKERSDPGRGKRLPNWLIAGLEDSQANDTDLLLWIRDALMLVEARLQDRMHIVGQIRNGEYHKEQPAARRREAK